MIPISAKKKIVIFSAFYEPFMSGAEQMVKEILERLNDRFDFVLITALLDKRLPRQEKRNGFLIVRVGLGHKLIDKLLYPLLAPLVARRYRPDLIHAIMESYAGGALVLAKLFSPGAKRLLTLQSGDLDHEKKQKKFLINFFFSLIHNSPDYVSAISNFLAQRARRLGVPADRISIVPNGVDFLQLKADQTRRPASVVCVARLSWEKGLDCLVKAWPEVVKNCPSAKLELIGEGDKRAEIERLIDELKISGSIILRGNLPHDQVLAELQKNEIFICPSLAEGLGIVFIEAQACGCAVIGTKVGGIPDVIENNINGLLIEPKDSITIAQAIIKLLNDGELRHRLSAVASESVKKFAWPLIMEQVGDLYSRLLKKNRLLLCAGIYPPDLGGPATFAKKLAGGLAQNDYEVTVLTFGRAADNLDSAEGVRISRVDYNMSLWRRYAWYFLELRRLARSADIVYGFDITSVGLPAAFLKLFNRRIKLVFRLGGDAQWERAVDRGSFWGTLTDYYSQKKFSLGDRLYYFLTQFVLNRADRLIFNAYYLQDLYIKYRGIEPFKTAVIKNITIAEMPPVGNQAGEESRQQAKTILYAGRLIGFKNIFNLIKAVEILIKRRDFPEGLTLKIFGEGTKTEAIKRYIADRQLEANVVLKAKLSSVDLEQEIRACDLAANPSLSEVNSNFVGEALALGKKVLLTRESEQYFTQLDNPLIYYADPFDVNDLAEKLSHTLLAEVPAILAGDQLSAAWPINQVIGRHEDVFRRIFSASSAESEIFKINFNQLKKKFDNLARIFYWFVWHDLKQGKLKPIAHLGRTLLRHYFSGIPYAVIIETGNTCNFHCPTCPTPHSVIHNKRPMEMMPYDKFCRIIDNVKDCVHIAYLYNSNEPLLNPHIVEMIKYAATSGLHTMISTNASLLDEAKSREILASGLGEIRFAFDGLTKESFEAFRAGGDFAMVKKNIETFCRLKQELKVAKPIITLQFILNKLNEDQVDDIKKFCADNRIDRLYIKPFILSGYAYAPEQIRELSEKFFVDKLVNDENVVYEKKDGLLTPKIACAKCSDVDKVFTVLSDGRAVMCCFDLLGDYVYGQMDQADLKDLWFSEQATLIRNKARRRIFPLCRVCGNVE